jgi:hypothetical protein
MTSLGDFASGCRDFTGPVPQSLRISTDCLSARTFANAQADFDGAIRTGSNSVRQVVGLKKIMNTDFAQRQVFMN